MFELRLGVKRVTEPNRTEPPDYTGQSLRKIPILAVPGFTAVTEPNYLALFLTIFLNLITHISRSTYLSIIYYADET